MTNSIKISPQRTSFILSVSVILYWATDSYLYLSCHINLMEYSTPVILYITAMILACGVLQRFFFRFITKNELSLSFDKQVRALPEQIKEIDPKCPKDKDINPENLVVKHDYMDNYEVRVAEIEREKAERQADIKRIIHEYTTFVMTEFLSKEDLEILHENIEYFAHGQSDLYKPIRSKVDNSLRSIDLMHFVWNIGERLGISLIDRATFIQHPKAIDTFVEVIENNYPDLIHELNILHANVNLVTRELSEQYAPAQKEITDGWLVFTNINTRRKREDLLKISEELELGLKVDLVSIATGEIITPTEEPNSSNRQKIKVTFPNGKTIQPNKVLEALIEVVKYAGPERVRDLGITVCADNLVLKNPKPRYIKPCKPVGNGWLVNTCSDTPTKYEQIKYISDKLSLNLSVEITN